MTLTLFALAVTQPITAGLVVFLLTRYLNQRDERESRERQVLCNRIQSPETAVAQTLEPVEMEELGPPDTEWTEMREHERMLDTFAEGA